MNKALVMLWGIGLITGIFTIAVIIRPGYMKFRETFNVTVYRYNETSVTNAWTKVRGTLDYSFVVVPGICAVIILIWIYMNMQKKEYYGAGYYR